MLITGSALTTSLTTPPPLEFLSKDIILHHANAVHGMRKKINQLDYISQVLTRL